MKEPLTLLICLKPFTCQKEKECRGKDSPPCALQISIDNAVAVPLSLPAKDVHGNCKTSGNKRVRRGKALFMIEQLGMEEKMLELFNDRKLTYKQIIEVIYDMTGKKISKSSISRYYRNIIESSYKNEEKEKTTGPKG